ncbi:MAG TPA: hypothetical protein HA349_04360 [Methanotrichaceae archaeon]|nr:hypothetical protein [Methanotrichaceae archaeon]
MNDLARWLNCTQEQIEAICLEVAESHWRDRGWSLIEAAIADPAPEPDKV